MTTHHCCDPHHADLERLLRKTQSKWRDAEARARWAETTEAVLAEKLDDLLQEHPELDRR